jgi:hypothetical protein
MADVVESIYRAMYSSTQTGNQCISDPPENA